MPSRWVCRYCIATHGLKGSELASWPASDDREAQCEHIESEHHIPVRREGESDPECRARFRREYPEAEDPATCKCPECSMKRRRAERAIS